MEIKYIYTPYGQVYENMIKILDESGIFEKINELADKTYELIKDENFDRTQMEAFVIGNFEFELIMRIMQDPISPISIEKITGEDENNGSEKVHG